MTETAEGIAGPKRETTLALPLFRAEAQLDWRDALAWEDLPRELTQREYWVYIAVLVLFGMALGALGEHLPGWVQALPQLVLLLAVVGVAHLVWNLGFALAKRSWARRRFPAPMLAVLEDWGDHIYLRFGPDEDVMVPEAIRQVVTSASHVFVEDIDRLAIVPLRVCDAGAAREFAERWDQLTRTAQD